MIIQALGDVLVTNRRHTVTHATSRLVA